MIKLNSLTKAELIRLIDKYDIYIKDYIEDHGVCEDGCCPVCLKEFYDNEFQFERKK
jgi:hypothetical protein